MSRSLYLRLHFLGSRRRATGHRLSGLPKKNHDEPWCLDSTITCSPQFSTLQASPDLRRPKDPHEPGIREEDGEVVVWYPHAALATVSCSGHTNQVRYPRIPLRVCCEFVVRAASAFSNPLF